MTFSFDSIVQIESAWRSSSQKLSDKQISELLFFADTTRYPLRNRVIVLLSCKAGLRAGEIANLTWDMMLDADGRVSTSLDSTERRRQERQRPAHPE